MKSAGEPGWRVTACLVGRVEQNIPVPYRPASTQDALSRTLPLRWHCRVCSRQIWCPYPAYSPYGHVYSAHRDGATVLRTPPSRRPEEARRRDKPYHPRQAAPARPLWRAGRPCRRSGCPGYCCRGAADPGAFADDVACGGRTMPLPRRWQDHLGCRCAACEAYPTVERASGKRSIVRQRVRFSWHFRRSYLERSGWRMSWGAQWGACCVCGQGYVIGIRATRPRGSGPDWRHSSATSSRSRRAMCGGWAVWRRSTRLLRRYRRGIEKLVLRMKVLQKRRLAD